MLLVSSTLIICYIRGLFYTKTKIPDMTWVLGTVLFAALTAPILAKSLLKQES